MSTIVTYKDSTLMTVENSTKYLLTAGKYMEDNITISDITSGGAAGGVTQDENGYLVLGDEAPEKVAITIVESDDSNGGLIENIVAVDISNDNVDAEHLWTGYTAHNSSGQAVTGTYSPPWTINELTLTTDTATVNELLAILASNLRLYGTLVFWIKTINTNEVQGRAMGGYAYKAGASNFTGGFMRYQTGWSGVSGGTSTLVAKTGDVFCWIEGLPGWK